MKKARHELIIQMIEQNDIETQEELTDRLREKGMNVTQATISRDIKELQLIKVATKDGGYKYAVSGQTGTKTVMKFKSILKETIVSVDYAENIVVLRTYSGMAQAAAAAIDAMHVPQIVGSVAGDDNIFVVMRTKESAQHFCNGYKKYVK